MSTSVAAVELASYFRAAAEQRRQLAPRSSDRRMLAEGKKVFHAVDADVVMLFTDPFENAVGTKTRRTGYGEVFPQEDAGTAIGVGQILADYIFFKICENNSLPLLLLHPIDQELREVFRVVLQKAMEAGVKAREQVAEVQRLAAQIQKVSDAREQASMLIKTAPFLFGFLAGSRGPRAELERFSRLMESKRIVPLDELLAQDWQQNEKYHPAFKPPERFADFVDWRHQAHLWFERIASKATSAKKANRIQNDATMLASLERINRRLGEDGRLVLITGDSSIHEAARGYFPDDFQNDGPRSFANLWLRHPRAYLAEPEVLSPKSNDTDTRADTDFLKWLDTFLGKLELTGRDHLEALDELLSKPLEGLVETAGKVLESHPNILNEFKERWSAYTCNAILVHGVNNNPEAVDNKQIAQLVQTITEHLEHAESDLEQRLATEWDRLFHTAIEAGFLFAREMNVSRRPRNPPVLHFESLPVARKFIKRILATEQHDNIKNFEGELKKLRAEDPFDYTYTLVFGILFAAQGAWAVAAILAERALNIASAIDRESKISGREAYYLQAVARRHQIRTVDKLPEVGELLDKAARCLARERQTRSGLLTGDIRFAAEKCALHITYHLFQQFLKEKIPESVPTLGIIETELKSLLDLNAEYLSASSEAKQWVALNVERNLLTNLFMVALLQYERKTTFPQELVGYFKRFEDNIQTNVGMEIPVTFLVNSVYGMALWWKETDPREKKKIRDKIQGFLSDGDIERKAVMPYDKARFSFMRSLVQPHKTGS